MRRRDAAAAPDAATDGSRRGKAGRRASKRDTAACRGAAANVERGAATAARKVMAHGRVERRQLARLSRLRAGGARLLVGGSGGGGDAGAVVTLALWCGGCGSDARAVEEEKAAQTAAARRESEGSGGRPAPRIIVRHVRRAATSTGGRLAIVRLPLPVVIARQPCTSLGRTRTPSHSSPLRLQHPSPPPA
jgi:hypothetical protein